MKFGQVPKTIPRWEPPTEWNEDINSRCYPDRPKDQDSTVLNLLKQKHIRDPRKEIDEQLEVKKEILKTIASLIQKPLKGSDGEVITSKVAAKRKYLVAHFSFCYNLKHFYYPAEFAIAEFSVFNGLGKGVQGLIDTGKVPIGYDGAVRERKKVTRNPHPTFSESAFDPYDDALKIIEGLCRQHFPDNEEIILFCFKEHVPIVIHGLVWLFEKTGKFFPIRVLPLNELCKILANLSQTPEYRGTDDSGEFYHVDHESQLDAVLHNTYYAYSPELACHFHSLPENYLGVLHCSESNVKRTIFNTCTLLTPFFRVEFKKNAHYPRYQRPDVKPEIIRGMKMYNLPNQERMCEIARFATSERMAALLRSQSMSSLQMQNSDSLDSFSSGSGSGSRTSISGIGSESDLSTETVDTVDMDPPDDSKRILDYFRVAKGFSYGPTIESLLSDDDYPLPRVPGLAQPSMEDAMSRYCKSKSVSGSSVSISAPQQQLPLKPVGRGRGRILGSSSSWSSISIGSTGSIASVKSVPKDTSVQGEVYKGQFEDDGSSSSLPPRRRPVSRCFDKLSVKTTWSSGSLKSDFSAGSERPLTPGVSQGSSHSASANESASSYGSDVGGSNEKIFPLEPWELPDDLSSVPAPRSSASQAMDSVSTIGGYQVDELTLSDDELTDGNDNFETSSIIALKNL